MQNGMLSVMTVMRATKTNVPTTPPIIASVDEPWLELVGFGISDGSKFCAESDNEFCVETCGWRKTCVGGCSLVCVGDGIAVERGKHFHDITITTNHCQGIQCVCEVWKWQVEFRIQYWWVVALERVNRQCTRNISKTKGWTVGYSSSSFFSLRNFYVRNFSEQICAVFDI